MKNWVGALLLPLLMLVFHSCGYRYGRGEAQWVGSTISVPFVNGDCTGNFTQALIRELSTSGSFRYVNAGGRYRLCVSILCQDEDNIGFRYDTDRHGNLTTTTIPIETRARVVAEFSLVHACSGETVVGPERVSAWIDYDHEYTSGSDSLNLLSLGQVTDMEAASIVVPPRLGQKLAQRIVDYIGAAW